MSSTWRQQSPGPPRGRALRAGALRLAAAVAFSGAAALAPRAFATDDYARRTGQGCSTCHAGPPSSANVNASGRGFAGCRLDQSCIADWSASLARPSPATPRSRDATPAAAPPGRPTSENFAGLAEIGNRAACPGSNRIIIIRPGRDEAARDIGLIIEPGQTIKLVVSKRSTWISACGKSPNDSDRFNWVPLTLTQQQADRQTQQ